MKKLFLVSSFVYFGYRISSSVNWFRIWFQIDVYLFMWINSECSVEEFSVFIEQFSQILLLFVIQVRLSLDDFFNVDLVVFRVENFFSVGVIISRADVIIHVGFIFEKFLLLGGVESIERSVNRTIKS